MKPIMTKKSRPESPLYPKHHKAWDLEPYYCQHISGMTEFELHDKSDIAEQLAWRDKRIAELEALCRNLATDESALRADQPAATETGPMCGMWVSSACIEECCLRPGHRGAHRGSAAPAPQGAPRDKCPSCWALVREYVITPEGDACNDPWHSSEVE